VSILLAMIIDHCWGEPPVRLHPVVWMGRYLKRVGRHLPDRAPWLAFVLGTAFWVIGAVVAGAAYGLADYEIAKLPGWLALTMSAVLLKPLFALRMLVEEVRAVERALQVGIEQGRARLAHIVSRDTSLLDEVQIRESALESLAENLSDSVIAPLFWFAIFGLTGAVVYRFANTADAMWGYRGRWEWAGKFAARADDVLNWLPARITALVLLWLGPRGFALTQALPGEASNTPSPNSGWPMAALALSMGVKLCKPGVYALNACGRTVGPHDTRLAIRRSQICAWVLACVFAAGSLYLVQGGWHGPA
jgi:adenosylcobinamide-phosphate synthase